MRKRILSITLMICTLAVCFMGSFSSSATPTEPTTAITAHNLALEDTIEILYYVESANVPNGAEEGILFWYGAQSAYTYGQEDVKLTNGVIDQTQGHDRLKYRFDRLAAKQMTDEIYAVPYVKAEETITYGALDKYSILQYCKNKEGSPTVLRTGAGATLGELVEGILEYGAIAQKAFNYHTERLATDSYAQIQVTGGILPDGLTKGLYKIGTQVTLTAEAGNNFWYVGGQVVDSGSSITITVQSDASYTVSGEVSYSEGFSYVKSGSEYWLSTANTNNDTYVRIPPTYLGLPVTKISMYAFNGKNSVQRIDIPASVEVIEEDAFKDCRNLVAISVASGNTAYESVNNCLIEKATGKLLKGCSTSTIPDDGCAIIISRNAFVNMIGLTSVVIPNSVTTIGTQAFMNCSNIATLTIGSGVTSINQDAFSGCTPTTVNYNGTMEQWNAITKNISWHTVQNWTIHCTDGDVTNQ